MVLAIIPARYASTRFPGKPLVDIGGKSMIQRVYEQAAAAQKVEKVVVATDDARIYDHVRLFGGEVCMTRADHASGTDRCAEVARLHPEATHIINVQGDEPFLQPAQIDLLVDTLLAAPETGIATLVKRISDTNLLFNPNVVKAVVSVKNFALYFSRQPIPYLRGTEPAQWAGSTVYYKHIGLYGFTRTALLEVAQLPQTPLELAESLEQLRWLENGYRIAAGITELETTGIDSPEDLDRIQDLINS